MNSDLLTELYLEYDPDSDHNGSIGIKLAENMLKRFNYDIEELKRYICSKRLEKDALGNEFK